MRYTVIVKPNAPKNEVSQRDDVVHVWVREPAHEGKANEKAIVLLAKFFGVPKSSVLILSGEKTKYKTVEIL